MIKSYPHVSKKTKEDGYLPFLFLSHARPGDGFQSAHYYFRDAILFRAKILVYRTSKVAIPKTLPSLDFLLQEVFHAALLKRERDESHSSCV